MKGEPRRREIPVPIADGTRLVAELFEPRAGSEAPIVVCFPAMGIRASYYRPLAEALCRQGLRAVTVDLRGNGSSSVRASRSCDFGYREIVELDIPAVLTAVRREVTGDLLVLGHSLGGQLACLAVAADPRQVTGVVLVASCSVYYRGWSFPRNLRLLAFFHTANLSAQLFGFFPGYLVRFGDREARRLVRDWSRQGRTGRYRVAGSRLDYEALLSTLDLPILALSFTDDTYSPRRAVEHLLGKMPAATATHLHLPPEDLGNREVGHFGWVRHAERLTPRILQWLGSADRDRNG